MCNLKLKVRENIPEMCRRFKMPFLNELGNTWVDNRRSILFWPMAADRNIIAAGCEKGKKLPKHKKPLI
jgi:hypothetical protein